MDEKQTQPQRQLKSTPGEEQHPLSQEQASSLPAGQCGSMAQQVSHCANCDIEFFWSPTVRQGKIYCCAGCAAGGPCNCDYSLYRSSTILGVIHYEQ